MYNNFRKKLLKVCLFTLFTVHKHEKNDIFSIFTIVLKSVWNMRSKGGLYLCIIIHHSYILQFVFSIGNLLCSLEIHDKFL